MPPNTGLSLAVGLSLCIHLALIFCVSLAGVAGHRPHSAATVTARLTPAPFAPSPASTMAAPSDTPAEQNSTGDSSNAKELSKASALALYMEPASLDRQPELLNEFEFPDAVDSLLPSASIELRLYISREGKIDRVEFPSDFQDVQLRAAITEQLEHQSLIPGEIDHHPVPSVTALQIGRRQHGPGL